MGTFPSMAEKDSTVVPTVAEVNRISLLLEPVSRNLQITACYWDLSNSFTSRTGIVANWCSFATWASKQAGVTIRKEDIKRKIGEVLRKEPVIQEILSDILRHSLKLGNNEAFKNIHEMALAKLVETVAERAGDAVARGNKKVYEEIGKEFARFISTCTQDDVYSDSTITGFCKELRPGDPPDGQDYLCKAFTRYYQSFFETDIKKQRELQLLANIEIGFHEQTRLQPEIAESLNASMVSPDYLWSEISSQLAKSRNFIGRILFYFMRLMGKTSLLKRASDQLVNAAGKPIREVITKHLMTITIPPAILHLGEDLSIPFPENLRILQNAELLALLKNIEPTVSSPSQPGARDWSNLKQRLHFIADLFRCYHESKDLFGEAFTPDQIKTIRTGGVPAGIL